MLIRFIPGNKFMKIKKHFSLVELLLVMVITVIMLGIVIPTFHKITKGVSVEMAARQLGAQLKAVREYAITNREYVALIMEAVNVPSPQLPFGYKFVAYRACIVTKNGSNWSAGGDGSNDSDWVYGERWEFLPEGAQIEDMSNFDGDEVSGVTDDGISLVNETIAPIVVFSPTGKCEGVSGSGATLTISDITGIDTDLKQNKVYITVAGYTGRISYGQD